MCSLTQFCAGHVDQFAEVKKPKDRARSKVKDTSAAADSGSSARGGTRGDRRGGDSIRGRGRGADRGRGGFRGGARGGAVNGARASGTSVPTVESPAWDVPATSAEATENGKATPGEQPAAVHASEPDAPKVAPTTAPPVKTWASMFAKPKPASVVPKPAAQLQPPAAEEPKPVPIDIPTHEIQQEAAVQAEELPIPPVADEVVEEPPATAEVPTILTPEKQEQGSIADTDADLTPSKDELTKDNVEHLPDMSHPPPTETAASTVASSRDIGVATPLSTSGQAPIGRPAIGGFATTALKATSGAPHRSASFQRRLLEQQEAVVMPGNHAVDRAAVQFGSLGLNGDLDADSLDVDEDREDAETRTQPPQHSPVAQPRASLPPAPRQTPQAAEQAHLESVPTPKQAPGLPPPPQQQPPLSQQSPSTSLSAQPVQNQTQQGSQHYNQFGRYGQSGAQQESAAPQQKSYDPFGQQVPQASQFDYNNQQQSQNLGQPQLQQQPQQQAGGFSSAPDSFASQYLTSEQQRSAYQNYYQNYGQQHTPSQQEAGSAQQRTGSAFGAGPTDSSFPPSQQPQVSHFDSREHGAPAAADRTSYYGLNAHRQDLSSYIKELDSNDIIQSQSRYNEAQNSGHNTPNPSLGGQHPSGPASQGQHMHQPHAQQGHAGAYPYNHPYYGTPYYANYMNQFGSYNQGGYGGQGFGGKGMYGQPHHYGMSPQASFDQHSSSPANVGGFGQSSIHGRDSGLGGGLGEYGRSASGASQNQHATAGGFGGLPDVFSRSQGYPNQSSSYGQQQSGQQGGSEDSLKPFGDTKSAGPSPSALGTQPGRPGSATNNTQGQSGQGLPPHSHQQGFGGGYPGHFNQSQGGQGNQYGGLGGLGHQGGGSHQQSGYGGSYGGFGGGYGSYNRGGWGTNYGQH